MILWGPPGTGKTTVARLLADETQPRLRAALGHLLGRAGPAQGLRPRQGTARDRQGHAAVHRRDPPLQPRAAGQLPAPHGGRHHHAGRRHDREPVLRAQRRVALAAPGAGVPPARRGGAGGAAGPRREGGGAAAAARRGGARDAEGHGRRRRPHDAQPGRGAVRLASRPARRRSTAPPSPSWCSAARRSTTSRATATTT